MDEMLSEKNKFLLHVLWISEKFSLSKKSASTKNPMKKTLLPRLLATSAAALALLAVHSALAADYTWNGGANSTWTTANFTGAPASLPTTTDNVTFSQSNSAQIVTLQPGTVGGNVTLNGLIFNNTGTTGIRTDGGGNETMTLGAGGLTINLGAGAVTFGTTTNGGKNFFVLSANQTWTNNSVTAMVLNANNTINNGGFTLTVAGTGNITTAAGIISGTGGITVNTTGTGTLTLGAAVNTFSGDVKVTSGKLYLSGNRSLNNGVLDTANIVAGSIYNNAGAASMANMTIGGLKGSTALASLFGANYTSTVTTLTINTTSTTNATYGGVIADGATGMTLTKTGTGVQTLSGANSYTGGTSVSAGTLVVTSSGTLGATTGNLSVGTTAAGGTGNLDLGGTSQTVGYVTFNGSGTTSNGTLTGARPTKV